MTNPFKVLFDAIIKQLLQLLSKFYPQIPRPSSSADAIDAEVPSQAVGEDAVDLAEAPAEAARINGGVNPAQAARNGGVNHMEWAEIVIAACWASAIDIALQSVQVKSQLPAAFHLLSFAILLAFASFCVSKFIKSKFLVTAQVLEKFGVFFTATAFFIAITIPFPFYLKFASWAVYTISMLAILI